MENYQIIKNIGEGSFGRVFKAVEKDTGHVFALKFIPKVDRSEGDITVIRRECEIQLSLCHPNVIRMVKYFETESEVVAVTEFAEGVLFDLFKPGVRRQLPEYAVQEVAVQLLSAVFYLHSNRIFHRDLKPQNVLLGADGVIKVCDFGFAKVLDKHTYVLTSVKGTPLYMAPEVIEEHPYDHGADLWSLGCILYELLVGTPPFCTGSLVQLVKKIRHEAIIWPEGVSTSCLSFLQGLLEKKPLRRFSWQNILVHPFVKDGIITTEGSGLQNPLTNPLTPSQELAKEIQRQDLFQKAPLRTRFLSGMQHQIEGRRNSAPLKPNHAMVGGWRPVAPMVMQRRNTTANYGGFQPQTGNVLRPLGFNLNPYSDQSNFQICTAQQNIEDMRDFSEKITQKLSTVDLTERPMTRALDSKPFGNAATCQVIEYTRTMNSSSDYKSVTNIREMECRQSQEHRKDEKTIIKYLSESTSKSEAKTSCVGDDMQNDEWREFLDEALSDAVESVDTLLDKNMLQMFIGPLASKSLSPDNLERISTLLILPLMADDKTPMALKVYAELDIISCLLSAAEKQIGDTLVLRSDERISSIESVINVISYLCHSQLPEFLKQLENCLQLQTGCQVLTEVLCSTRFPDESKRDVLSLLAALYKETGCRNVIKAVLRDCNILGSLPS